MAQRGTKKIVKKTAARSRMSGGEVRAAGGLLAPPTKFPTFWSFSRWALYRSCPRNYMLDKIKKLVPFKGNSATERGDTVHKMAEAYLKGRTKGLPDELNNFKTEFTNLRKVAAKSEEEWCVTKDGKKTHGQDWNGVWLRAKVDAHATLDDDTILIIDFKTGRIKPDMAQLDLYAALSTLYYDVENIEVEIWFLDHQGEDAIFSKTYTRREAEALWRSKWRERATRMLEDRTFKPKPSLASCKYCQYRSDKELPDGQPGPCDEHKKAAE